MPRLDVDSRRPHGNIVIVQIGRDDGNTRMAAQLLADKYYHQNVERVSYLVYVPEHGHFVTVEGQDRHLQLGDDVKFLLVGSSDSSSWRNNEQTIGGVSATHIAKKIHEQFPERPEFSRRGWSMPRDQLVGFSIVSSGPIIGLDVRDDITRGFCREFLFTFKNLNPGAPMKLTVTTRRFTTTVDDTGRIVWRDPRVAHHRDYSGHPLLHPETQQIIWYRGYSNKITYYWDPARGPVPIAPNDYALMSEHRKEIKRDEDMVTPTCVTVFLGGI